MADPTLPNAAKEIDFFDRLKSRGLVIQLDKPTTGKKSMESLASEPYDVVHFACHGSFEDHYASEGVQSNEHVIVLSDGYLRPDDLSDENIRLHFNRTRPLVFLNSCHSGRSRPILTSLRGWAQQFMKLDCGAVITCGWEVSDPLAAEFAIQFYRNLREKQLSLGEAFRKARTEIQTQEPDNSTWAAYYLFGNPGCSLKQSAKSSA